jgi:hypothetical protein
MAGEGVLGRGAPRGDLGGADGCSVIAPALAHVGQHVGDLGIGEHRAERRHHTVVGRTGDLDRTHQAVQHDVDRPLFVAQQPRRAVDGREHRRQALAVDAVASDAGARVDRSTARVHVGVDRERALHRRRRRGGGVAVQLLQRDQGTGQGIAAADRLEAHVVEPRGALGAAVTAEQAVHDEFGFVTTVELGADLGPVGGALHALGAHAAVHVHHHSVGAAARHHALGLDPTAEPIAGARLHLDHRGDPAVGQLRALHAQARTTAAVRIERELHGRGRSTAVVAQLGPARRQSTGGGREVRVGQQVDLGRRRVGQHAGDAGGGEHGVGVATSGDRPRVAQGRVVEDHRFQFLAGL